LTAYVPPLRDQRFVLFDLLRASGEWAACEAFADVNADLATTVLEEAGRLLLAKWLPLNRDGDEAGCRYADGVVTTPPGFRAAYRAWADGGWMSLAGDRRYGGQGMPRAITVLVDEMLYATNAALNLTPTLTLGATELLAAHASEEIRARYLPKLYAGTWTGVMALTEAHAGSDLGLIRTRAQPAADGSYRVTGTKIFITSGEHDLAENIVHLVLARLPDAPAGSAGISLFLVPKWLPGDDGGIGERNGVASLGIERKMGIHASPTNTMAYDAATGYLVGKPNQGLASMFTMMNCARLSVGVQGLGLGAVACAHAGAYARSRLQGRAAGQRGSATADPIVAHADVRRMLLTARALTEGGRAFAVVVGVALDRARHASAGDVRERAERRAALLTPVAKAFLSDRGFEACVLAQQVLGGHGYIRDNAAEQYVRDARIAQIYEGTNGIQALDLLGRKVVRDGGLALGEWLAEMRADLPAVPASLGVQLAAAIDLLQAVGEEILAGARGDADGVGAAASEYLDLFGYVAYAWLFARMAGVATAALAASPPPQAGDADFLADKVALASFYFARILPRTQALAACIRAGSGVLMALPDARV
jgi:alkylation response protein AidB-like acyl-CoA dehydrogenase